MNKSIKKSIYFCLILISVVLLTGCGKNESALGTVGAASGAIVGSAVSKHHKTFATIAGATIGNCLGRAVGQSIDENEEHLERKNAQSTEQIRRLYSENQKLSSENQNLRIIQFEKWCPDCEQKITIKGANCCPYCGCRLALEKHCNLCDSSFKPESDFNYCPYCRHRTTLCFR